MPLTRNFFNRAYRLAFKETARSHGYDPKEVELNPLRKDADSGVFRINDEAVLRYKTPLNGDTRFNNIHKLLSVVPSDLIQDTGMLEEILPENQDPEQFGLMEETPVVKVANQWYALECN